MNHKYIIINPSLFGTLTKRAEELAPKVNNPMSKAAISMRRQSIRSYVMKMLDGAPPDSLRHLYGVILTPEQEPMPKVEVPKLEGLDWDEFKTGARRY